MFSFVFVFLIRKPQIGVLPIQNMPFVPDAEWEAILAKQASMEKRVAELEALLRKYDNAHTQSSMQGVGANKIGGNKSHGKPGRKDGQDGVGRKAP